MFVKHYAPLAVNSKKAIFSIKVTVKDTKVIDLGVIWKGNMSGVCMPNMKLYILWLKIYSGG